MARNTKRNKSDLSRNTRTKLVSSLKAQLATLTGSLASEIARLNADEARPIHRVNDLAEMPFGESVGESYLLAPEHLTREEIAWAAMLGKLYQDAKQLERKILRAEVMAKGE